MRNKAIPNKKKNNTKTTTKQQTVCIDEYKNFKIGRTFVTNHMLEELGKELVDWAEQDPNALKLKQFYGQKGISEKKFNEWCIKFPQLDEDREQARMHLGNRREIGALHRELDVGMVVRMMPKYDKDWDDVLVRLENLKKKDGESNGETKVICVGLEKFPDCAEVRPLKKDE